MANEALILEALFASRPRPVDDDAALVPESERSRLLVATDALEEGVHFRDGWLSIEDLAWKLLAVNLSDLAAMGAEPAGYVLSLAWPSARPPEDATRLGRALHDAERAFDCPLLGGDTDVRPGPLRLEATILGHSARWTPRDAGLPGDVLFVTGPLGGAAAVVERLLGGQVLDEGDPSWADAARRFRRPVPRLDAGRRVRSGAHAVIDLSDSLVQDAARLARSSGLAALIDAASVPLHPVVPRERARPLALEGGEDYELLIAGEASLAAIEGLHAVGRLERGKAGDVAVS